MVLRRYLVGANFELPGMSCDEVWGPRFATEVMRALMLVSVPSALIEICCEYCVCYDMSFYEKPMYVYSYIPGPCHTPI